MVAIIFSSTVPLYLLFSTCIDVPHKCKTNDRDNPFPRRTLKFYWKIKIVYLYILVKVLLGYWFYTLTIFKNPVYNLSRLCYKRLFLIRKIGFNRIIKGFYNLHNTVCENIIATTKIRVDYGAIQSFNFPILQ